MIDCVNIDYVSQSEVPGGWRRTRRVRLTQPHRTQQGLVWFFSPVPILAQNHLGGGAGDGDPGEGGQKVEEYFVLENGIETVPIILFFFSVSCRGIKGGS